MNELIDQILELGIFKNIIFKLKNRNIYIYGAGVFGREMSDKLSSRGIKVNGFIDGDSKKQGKFYKEIPITALASLDNMADKPYIVVCMNYYEEVENNLKEKNYIDILDYFYTFHKPIVITNCKNYNDIYGNRIISGIEQCEITFLGYNSILNFDRTRAGTIRKTEFIIGNNVNLYIDKQSNITDSRINCSDESKLLIGHNVNIINNEINFSKSSKLYIGNDVNIINSRVNCSDSSKLLLGDNNNITDSKVNCSDGSKLSFGNNNSIISSTVIIKNKGYACFGNDFTAKENCYFEISGHYEIGNNCAIFPYGYIYVTGRCCIGSAATFGPHLQLIATFNSEIVIGEDCMFAMNLKLISGDGHCIFDLVNNELTNLENKNIFIGNHVWSGMSCSILYSSVISDGCIVGADSFVKGKFTNNCMIGGRPAAILKKDIAWDRKIPAEADRVTNRTYWNLSVN